MRKLLALSVIGLGAVVVQPVASFAQAPEAVIELSGGSAAAGVGITWGHGTLVYQGKRYPLTVSGAQIAAVGVHEYTAAGSVEGLKTPEDIDGIFTTANAGVTVAGGGSVSALRNQNGVVIYLNSTSSGLSLSLAVGGMKIALAN